MLGTCEYPDASRLCVEALGGAARNIPKKGCFPEPGKELFSTCIGWDSFVANHDDHAARGSESMQIGVLF